jgi:hypothetical protein
VAAFGNTSYDLVAGGTGSGNVNRAYTISVAQGLDSAGLPVDTLLAGAYTRYLAAERAKLPPRNPMMDLLAPPKRIAELAVSAALVRDAAGRAAAAVVTIGRVAGEGGDRKVADDFELTAAERALLQQVSAAFRARGKPVVVVLNVGGPVEVASWRDQADAIVLAWQPGQEGGHAVADVLAGRVNPSGKLATTFPMRYADVPYAADFPGRTRPGSKPATGPLDAQASENTYAEGVYVGYRYHRTFGRAPAYAFGHGMSYTTFRYGGLRLAGTPNGHRDGDQHGPRGRARGGAALRERAEGRARQAGARAPGLRQDRAPAARGERDAHLPPRRGGPGVVRPGGVGVGGRRGPVRGARRRVVGRRRAAGHVRPAAAARGRAASTPPRPAGADHRAPRRTVATGRAGGRPPPRPPRGRGGERPRPMA